MNLRLLGHRHTGDSKSQHQRLMRRLNGAGLTLQFPPLGHPCSLPRRHGGGHICQADGEQQTRPAKEEKGRGHRGCGIFQAAIHLLTEETKVTCRGRKGNQGVP